MSEFLSVRTVAERLNMSPQSVSRLIARGELTAHKLGGTYRIPAEAVERLLQQTLTVKGQTNERK